MEKKSIIIILLVVILIGVTAFLFTHNFNGTNDVYVGNTKFYLPDGYHEGNQTEYGDVNITNGYSSVLIHNYSDNNVKKYRDDYSEYLLNNNATPELRNFTVDDITIYKTTIVNNTQTMHYWFIKDNKTFSIYTWDGNSNMDSFIRDLISQ